MFDSLLTWGLTALLALGAAILLALVTLFALSFATIRYRRLRTRYANLDSLHKTLVQRYLSAMRTLDTYHVSVDDHSALEEIARTIAGEIEANLFDVEEVNVCTIPVPAIELVYSDGSLVTLHLTIDRTEEDEEDEPEPEPAAVGSGASHGD